jgi:hypothetical protein
MSTKIIEFDRITVAGNEISELRLRKPTAKEWLDSHKQMNGLPTEEGRQRQMHWLLWKMSGVADMKIIDELPFDVWQNAIGEVADFLEPTAKPTSSPTSVS